MLEAIWVLKMKFAQGNISKIAGIRLQRGEDMMASIEKACNENGINNGVILSIIGSLEKACFVETINNSNTKSGVSGSDLITLDGPVEVLAAQGEICHKDSGELRVHIHATLSDSEGHAYGGHILGEGNITLCTINIVIGLIDGLDMGIEWDEKMDVWVFSPKAVTA